MSERDTIFALSSGQPPAGIAVVRLSGPGTGRAVDALISGRRPAPRVATVRKLLHSDDGSIVDEALLLWLPGPHTVTGEDMAELHLHGSRAIVALMLDLLGRFEGLRPALAGEFTRRAFENGRIDLIEAEALGDLLAAETEDQRRNAMLLASGALSRVIENWRKALLQLSARIEAILDFSDEDSVGEDEQAIRSGIAALEGAVDKWLAVPPAERLRDGIRVVLAGPPNAGKSTLLNALVGRDAAIVTPIAGTTRDLIEVPVAFGGVPFLITDTAGLRDAASDAVEAIGMQRAAVARDSADILLWMGNPEEAPGGNHVVRLGAQSDRVRRAADAYDLILSATTGQGLDVLIAKLIDTARGLLPREGEGALNRRQRSCLIRMQEALSGAVATSDLILMAEGLRAARAALDALTGRVGTEDMFDTLFGAFCIGK
jgi:tRNA modification GTPase